MGLYYDLRNPGRDQPWPSVYARTLCRIAAAEDAGIDAVWFSEHHGFADGYLPAPLTMAAAAAARTTRVRVGTAVVVAPLVHPQALAEQAAVVDLISGGRLELGLGAGWREPEFAAVGADFRRRYAALEAAVTGLDRRWSDGTATPPPVQRPLPTWIGARGPRGARIAGRTGSGLLWLDPQLLDPYRAGLADGGHPPFAARMGGLVNVFLADDPDAAGERIRCAARHNARTYAGNDRDAARPGATRSDATVPRLAVLTPADAADRIAERIRGLPVTDVFCWADVGDLGSREPALVDRHAELVAAVLPALLSERSAARAAP